MLVVFIWWFGILIRLILVIEIICGKEWICLLLVLLVLVMC